MGVRAFLSFALILFLSFFISTPAPAAEAASPSPAPAFSTRDLAVVPILHDGRVKPLETFARISLQRLYGRRALPDMSAVTWLAEALFAPETAQARPVFRLNNREIVSTLGLPMRDPRLYSFDELSAAIATRLEDIRPLLQKEEQDLTLAQEHLVRLYTNVLWFADLTRTFGALLPQWQVNHPEVAALLNVKAGSSLSYREIQASRTVIMEALDAARDLAMGDRDGYKAALTLLALQLQVMEQQPQGRGFRIIPPQWKEDGEIWFSPWSITERGRGSPESATYVRQWQVLAEAWREADRQAWRRHSTAVREHAVSLTDGHADFSRMALEAAYHRLDLFSKSLYAYLAAFFCVLLGYAYWGRALRRTAAVALGAGILAHLAGLGMRMLIMQRPPVTTLYESIIFVGLIVVMFGAWMEWKRRNTAGLLAASIAGAILHFLGFRYDADGDSMGMLVAVLDTNFWLATHVVTITIGYGCCLIGGTLAHIYLGMRVLRPAARDALSDLYRNIRGVSLVALFFATLGTILGGIWADQSWGRFWGWDPKENGALMIILWLLWLMHGRLAGFIGELGYAVGMVGTNIIVALAWFGVNLLSVGLHSYGFTKNIASNLAWFCGGEAAFALIALALIRIFAHTSTHAHAPSPAVSDTGHSGAVRSGSGV